MQAEAIRQVGKEGMGFMGSDGHPCAENKIFHFPKGFLWGVASSPSQVEEGLTNDWSETFISINAKSPDHIGNFATDIEIMAGLNINAYRFGIDWSRLQKAPFQSLDPVGVSLYRRVMQELRAKRLTLVVTLHHFANPTWLPRGEFRNSGTIKLFCDFVARAVQEFGDVVDYWNVINEPDVYNLDKYIVGVFPPFRKWAVGSAYQELRNLREAVRRCWDLLKERDQQVISIAKNFRYFYPFSGGLVESGVSRLMNAAYNDWVFENFFFPKGQQVTDIIGINYYGPTRFKGAKPFIPEVFPRDQLLSHGEFDDIQELDPRYLGQALQYVRARTDLPIMILENGVGTNDDSLRERVLLQTIQHLARSMRNGVEVRGYFHWSILDNIEWGFGNTVRFGLVQVDPHHSFARTPKRSAHLYSRIAKDNSINILN